MPSFRHAGFGAAALLGAMALAACDHANADLVGPLDAATLAEAATRISPTDLMADLGLDPGQQEKVAEEVGALHTAMLALHELQEGAARDRAETTEAAGGQGLRGPGPGTVGPLLLGGGQP